MELGGVISWCSQNRKLYWASGSLIFIGFSLIKLLAMRLSTISKLLQATQVQATIPCLKAPTSNDMIGHSGDKSTLSYLRDPPRVTSLTQQNHSCLSGNQRRQKLSNSLLYNIHERNWSIFLFFVMSFWCSGYCWSNEINWKVFPPPLLLLWKELHKVCWRL